MEGQDVKSAVATIDNGKFGKREIRFETGRLARQAAGTAVVYLDDDSMLLSATTASKSPREHLRLWLHLAQNELPSKVGAAREIIKAGISAAASELLFRWRYNL